MFVFSLFPDVFSPSSVSTSWHTVEDTYRAPPIDRSILPTAPRAAREPNVDRSRLPRGPPYTAFLGNLPYDVSEESIKDFFRGLAVSGGIYMFSNEWQNKSAIKRCVCFFFHVLRSVLCVYQGKLVTQRGSRGSATLNLMMLIRSCVHSV